MSAFGNRRSFTNSSIGGIGAGQINRAWERVLASDVRFRFVIDISTLAD